MTSISDLLEETRKRLVETGTRNRLIHVNRSAKRANVLNIINERSEDIFQILRIDSKKMRFSATGVEQDEERQDEIFLVPQDIEETFDEERYTDNLLETPLTPDALQKRLLRLAGNARIAEEEQGINILYLCLGFLRWYEDRNSSVTRESPLILLPVELVRNERSSTFDIKCRDDDIVTNLPLQERLKIDFGISLPEIDDSQDWTPNQYFSKLTDSISGQSRWGIDENGMQLGFFSFAKLLMLRDLDPENWSEGDLTENKLVSGLLSDGFESESPLFKEDVKLDEVLEPKDLFHVVDADSSQTKVIEEVNSGRNLVVQGPPGTGKSQTITNILSAAAHNNKTVLFVAEKMAALDVVHQRMLKSGLKDLCLELHSRSANKKAFLDELAETLANGRVVTPVAGDVSALKSTRDALNRLSDSLHNPVDDLEYSPFDVLSRLIDFTGRGTPPPQLEFPSLETISLSDEQKICEAINHYIDLVSKYGLYKNQIFYGASQLELQPTDLHRLDKEIDIAIKTIDDWQERNSTLARMLKQSDPVSIDKSMSLVEIASQLSSSPQSHADVLSVSYENATDSRFCEALKIGMTWISAKEKLEGSVSDTVWSHDVASLRIDLAKGLSSWISRVFGKYRSASKELGLHLKSGLPKSPQERLELLDEILDGQSKRKNFESETEYLRKRLGDVWRGERTDFSTISLCANWMLDKDQILFGYSVNDLATLLSDKKRMEFNIPDFLDLGKSVQVSAEVVVKRLNLKFEKESGVPSLDLSALKSRFQEMKNDLGSYDVWVKFSHSYNLLEKFGLRDLLTAIETGRLEAQLAKEEFLYALYEHRWNRLRDLRPDLNALSRTDRHKIVQEFRSSDKKRIIDVRDIIRSDHLSQLPQGSAGEMGLIRGEIAKKRRHKPIRQIINYAGTMVQRIKPVFLMSPISVAQFLPPGKVDFDLLVIDEASQVRPEDALGSIARAKQIVVVGDQKQLPPTSFFDRLADNTDSEEDQDQETDVLPTAKAIEMESILSLCEARGINQSMLEWHYRSRDPSLIAVSNTEFYGNRLILPPCPTQADESYGLKLSRVPGIYSSAKRGGGRAGTNRIEAEFISNRLSELAVSRPQFSVGIVTFSKAQADMVTEILELKRREDSDLDSFLSEGKQENVFVKNIENVQGDERDIILISVGYGPHEANGRLASMNFGPVNSDGGERRLNVLFSRSRIACEVFVSFDPREIDLARTTKEGPRVFKRYLEFANSGLMEEILPTGETPDSPFEEDVARAIRSLGYQVDYQVGTAGFKIDLGVKGPENSGHYILAVECDGATYHSALWARERDRMRQEVLEGFGWKFHRIWSTDWFYRRNQEIERLEGALDKAKVRELSVSIQGSNIDALAGFDTTPISTPVDRSALELIPDEIKVPLYEKAEIKVDYYYEPHECPSHKLSELLRSIVLVEGPIHNNELARRYAEAYGKTRVGSRILGAVSQGASFLEKNDLIIRSEEFWGTEDQFVSPKIRNRENETTPLTKPENISKEEITACAELVIKESGSVEQEELLRAISRVFGFKRAGPDFQSRVSRVLSGWDGSAND